MRLRSAEEFMGDLRLETREDGYIYTVRYLRISAGLKTV
jgi:hypothetical protein